MRLGFRNVWRFAGGWHGWLAFIRPGQPIAQPRGLRSGDFFPACRLVLLKAKSDRSYLGLPTGARSFALRQVRAAYLLVELYHELCYGCLRQVRAYNRLFKIINQDSSLARRLKMIGLGVGSQHRQVVRFRRREGVLFPLFADPRKDVFKCLGRPALPVLYLLRSEKGRGLRIVLIHAGQVGVQELIDKIKAVMDPTP